MRGQSRLSGHTETASPFDVMDGSNLQLLIVPKEFRYESSPKSHTWGRGRTEAKARGSVSKIGIA